MGLNRSVSEASDGTDVFGAPWEDLGVVGWISRNQGIPRKNREIPKITRCLMGLVRGPGVIEPAGIGPYRKRLMKWNGLGPSGRIFGCSIFGGSDRKLVCMGSWLLRDDDGAHCFFL